MTNSYPTQSSANRTCTPIFAHAPHKYKRYRQQHGYLGVLGGHVTNRLYRQRMAFQFIDIQRLGNHYGIKRPKFNSLYCVSTPQTEDEVENIIQKKPLLPSTDSTLLSLTPHHGIYCMTTLQDCCVAGLTRATLAKSWRLFIIVNIHNLLALRSQTYNFTAYTEILSGFNLRRGIGSWVLSWQRINNG